MGLTSQGAGVTVSAVIYPACRCGRPWSAHNPDGCNGYDPIRPVADIGTRAYAPPASWPLGKQLAARICWAVEKRLQGWREAL